MEKLEFKGTKREWILNGNGRTVQLKNGNTIAYTSNQFGTGSGYVSESKAEANAKLIAAAPDLLEFAQEMVRRCPNSTWLSEQAQKAIEKALK